MYRINNGLTEWSLDNNAFIREFVEKSALYGINPARVTFYSQQDEDKYIIQYLLKDRIYDGTYLEIGACDGKLYSNTLTLEKYFGFKGILIEPQKEYFRGLEYNRSRENNELYNCAVTNSDMETITFTGDNAEGGVLSSINTNLENRNWSTYEVPNKRMSEILENSKYEYIDFMIIDVEGSELSLLESIDFKYPIYCIIIEAHSGEQEKNKKFGEHLKANGFTYKERQRGNEVWINKSYYRSHLFGG